MKKLLILLQTALCCILAMQPAKRERASVHEQVAAFPSMTISPDHLDFGDQVVGHVSKPIRIIVTNASAKDLYINSIALTGDNQQEFAMVTDVCTGQKLGANKSCVIDVAFDPRVTGSRKAAVRLIDNAVDSPQTVRLTGNGINSVDVPPHR
ncbi:MAG: choice-of-anchor D domain-containing protein [Blastocatellia bacterium]